MTDSTKRTHVRARLLAGATSAALAASVLAFAAPAQALVQCSSGDWGGNAGNGTSAATAYEIATLSDLENISDSSCADEMVYYKQTADIDISSDTDWTPIGVWDTTDYIFSGHYDGQGFSITGLTQVDEAGLFGRVLNIDDEPQSATIANLSVSGAIDSDDYDYVGGLAGEADGATIVNVHSSVDVTGDSYFGGLVGYTDGQNDVATTIRNSSSSGDVTADDSDSGSYAGGLVGYADYNTNILNSTSSSNVLTTSSSDMDDVGGLVGYAYYTQISNSHATGNVTTDAGDDVGGLAGYAEYSSIDGSTASGTVSADIDDSYYVGGLVGYFYNSVEQGAITNSHYTGSEVRGYESVGGLVGYFDADGYQANIANSSVTTNVYGGNYYVGGAVGYSNDGGLLHNITVTGDVFAEYGHAGGIVGESDYLSAANLSYSGTVSATADGYIGGIAGYPNYSGFSHVSVSGTVEQRDCDGSEDYVGGLFGYFYESTVTYAHSSADVVATCSGNNQADQVGGLIGYAYEGTISNVAATGDVTADGAEVGGLVGLLGDYTHVNNAYSTGAVSGADDGIGGLIGEFAYENDDISVVNTYTTSSVSDTSTSADQEIGAWGTWSDADWTDNTASNFFVNSQYTIDPTSAIGVTAGGLKDAAALKAAGWKIAADGAWSKNNTWAMHSSVNNGYPYLVGLYSANPETCAPVNLNAITFTGNSSKLSKSAKAKLAANAAAIKASGCATVAIKGYKGASKKSKAVAAKRVSVAKSYLQQRLWDSQYFVTFGTTTVKSTKKAKLKSIVSSVS